MEGYFEKGVYYPPSKQPEELELIVRVKVEGMEELNKGVRVLEDLMKYGRVIHPDQQRLDVWQ
jgi:hypothetical protein